MYFLSNRLWLKPFQKTGLRHRVSSDRLEEHKVMFILSNSFHEFCRWHGNIWQFVLYVAELSIHNWAATCDFQQCGILTSLDLDRPVQPPFKLRNSKVWSVSSLTAVNRIFTRFARALIRLRVCAGWSEPWLVAHTTLLEISCHGSIIERKNPSKIAIVFLGNIFRINPSTAFLFPVYCSRRTRLSPTLCPPTRSWTRQHKLWFCSDKRNSGRVSNECPAH